MSKFKAWPHTNHLHKKKEKTSAWHSFREALVFFIAPWVRVHSYNLEYVIACERKHIRDVRARDRAIARLQKRIKDLRQEFRAENELIRKTPNWAAFREFLAPYAHQSVLEEEPSIEELCAEIYRQEQQALREAVERGEKTLGQVTKESVEQATARALRRNLKEFLDKVVKKGDVHVLEGSISTEDLERAQALAGGAPAFPKGYFNCDVEGCCVPSKEDDT